MKTVAKLFADLVAWRWSPAAGLLAASTLFVLVVVGLVPTEIGVPVANTKVVPKTAATIGPQIASGSDTSETTTASFANGAEDAPTPAAPTPRAPAAVSDFGRRGFSPRLDRPDPPPAPATPPPAPVIQPPVTAPGGPIGGIFSRIQGALRPGGPAAAAAAAAAQASANAANAANAAAPPAPEAPAAQPPPANPAGVAAAAVPPPPGAPPTPGAPAAYPVVPGTPAPAPPPQ